MSNDRGETPYAIGYQKPPIQSQFKKGRSGNPKGRPKGSENFATLIERELKKKVSITEHGVQKRVSKRHVTVKRIVNNAAGGDPKAISILLTEERSRAPGPAGSMTTDSMFVRHDADQQTIANLVDRIRASDSPALGAGEESDVPADSSKPAGGS